MRRPAFLLTAFAALALAFTPVLAEAKPGGGSSSGSRGSRTYSAPPPTQTAPNTARPMERTATQPSGPQQAGAPARPGVPPQAQPQRSFMGALAGGLLMGGLIGMFFGGGLMGGIGGFGAVLGMLLRVALIGGLIWLAFRIFRRRQPAPALAGGSVGYARQIEPSAVAGGAASGGAHGLLAREVQLTPQGYQAFELCLLEVNAAWSRRDLKGLRDFATPEMVGYFSQDYRDLDARGWRNETRPPLMRRPARWWKAARLNAKARPRFGLLCVVALRSAGCFRPFSKPADEPVSAWRGPCRRASTRYFLRR